ncbi:MAG: hypothetical protein NTX17_03005 [Candidatus Eisenbacteria bacterium]|nr:hypothetical protein [Candidatus Eisenbacteria bacterium]
MDNVTLDNDQEKNSYFPCPVCGEMLLVEITKNQKPYCTCNECGIQLFIRGKSGIQRFKQLLGKMEVRGGCKDLVRNLDYFEYLKNRLDQIQMEKPFWGTDKDLEFQEQIVRRQLARLRGHMKANTE